MSLVTKTTRINLFRFGFHWRVDVVNGVIPEGYALFDLPGLFIQNGVNLYERMNDPAYAVNKP